MIGCLQQGRPPLTFAHCGNPSHAGIGEWPMYETGKRATMMLDRRCSVAHAPFEEERAIWQPLFT